MHISSNPTIGQLPSYKSELFQTLASKLFSAVRGTEEMNKNLEKYGKQTLW